MYTINVIAVTLRLATETQHWTWIHGVTYIGSVALWYMFLGIEFSFPNGFAVTNGYMYWEPMNMFSTTYHWLTLLLTTWIVVMPAFSWNCWRQCFLPSVNEETRRTVRKAKRYKALQEEEEADEVANMSDAERKRRKLLFQGNNEFKNDINASHAMQGRANKVDKEVRTAMMVAKSISKFKGLSPAFRARAQSRESPTLPSVTANPVVETRGEI